MFEKPAAKLVSVGISLCLSTLAMGQGTSTPAVVTDTAPSAGAGSASVESAEQTWDAWRKEVTNPAPWWKWGADLRLREKYLHLNTLSAVAPTHERHIQRYRARWWNTFTPAENVELGVRLTYEGRHYATPAAYTEWYNSPLYIDQLYVKFNKLFDLPLTAVIGRQDLKFGDGWLVLDGTPMDGSRTNYLDAAKFTYKFDEINTTVDVAAVYQGSRSNAWLPTINNDIEHQTEQTERGAILWVTHKLSPETQISPYYIYYHGDMNTEFLTAGTGGPAFNPMAPGSVARGIDADLNTFGMHITHKFDENWKATLEGAGQFGVRNGNDALAYGVRSQVVYSFNDDNKTLIRGGYEYLTGDDPTTARYEGFDPLWGRWPQWSDYHVYAFAAEGRVSEATNFHRIQVGLQSDLFKDFMASADYHYLLADENTRAGALGFTNNGKETRTPAGALLQVQIQRVPQHPAQCGNVFPRRLLHGPPQQNGHLPSLGMGTQLLTRL
ncbi:MAG: alginate export family protein [Phycisphaerales bacterium]|nr:alginate export family protein [Phycisphaerales bacterium]